MFRQLIFISIFIGSIFSLSYDVKITLDSYDGIRPGTKVYYNQEKAGKSKSKKGKQKK